MMNKPLCFAAIKRFPVIDTINTRDLPEAGESTLTALHIETGQYFFNKLPEMIGILPDTLFMLFTTDPGLL